MTDATLRQQIEDVLADGPATAGDVALELEQDWRRINAYLRDLWLRGHLLRQPFHPAPRGPGVRRTVWMYSLPLRAA